MQPFRPLLAITGVLALLAGACVSDASSSNDTGEGSLVVATTSQIGALVSEVAGEDVELHVVLAPGVNPHDYEPSPSEVARISDAVLVLRHGIGLDDFLDSAVDAAGDARVVTVTAGIELRSVDDHADHEEEHEDDHEEGEHEDEAHSADDGHDHGEHDPHVWHDPVRVQVMVQNIADTLAETFPDRAREFQTNAEAYRARLDEVDAEIRGLFEVVPADQRRVVTAHDSMGYFLDRYEIEFLGAVIPTTASGAETSARALAELQELIEHEGARAILVERSVDPAIAEQLARDTGVSIVSDLYGDTLGEPESGAETVDGMLLHNARRIAEALQ